MTLYNAMASGLLDEGDNTIIQVLHGSGRMRVSSWSVSFSGIVAGNPVEVKLVQDFNLADAPPATLHAPGILDASYRDTWQGSPFDPTVLTNCSDVGAYDDILDGPFYLTSTSYWSKQYASRDEPVPDFAMSLRVATNSLSVPTCYKANIIFVA